LGPAGGSPSGRRHHRHGDPRPRPGGTCPARSPSHRWPRSGLCGRRTPRPLACQHLEARAVIAYALQVALQSLRQSPWLAALVVLVVGVGISASMTIYALLLAMTLDPIPQRSAHLYAPARDSVGVPLSPGGERQTLPLLPYRDALALWEGQQASRQAMMYPTRYAIAAARPGATARDVHALATQTDFFAMFDLRFRSGGAWTPEQERAAAAVLVLAAPLAEDLFPGSDAVGKDVLLDGIRHRVVG